MAAQPLVLVVEDDPDALELRVRQLKSAGCRPIGVTNSDDAIREIWNSPLLGAVLTDINLERPGDDKSGIALARYTRRYRPELPVSGYSGVFGEDRLNDEELGLFDHYYSAGSLSGSQIRDAMREVVGTAVTYQDHRRREADARLQEVRRQQGVSADDFEAFRNLVPDQHLATEQVLADADLHARVVGPDDLGAALVALSKDAPQRRTRLRIPILVWIREGDDEAEAEVHGVPELYAFGADAEQAVQNVLDLGLLYFDDLREAGDVGGPLARLRDFLVGVFVVDEE